MSDDKGKRHSKFFCYEADEEDEGPSKQPAVATSSKKHVKQVHETASQFLKSPTLELTKKGRLTKKEMKAITDQTVEDLSLNYVAKTLAKKRPVTSIQENTTQFMNFACQKLSKENKPLNMTMIAQILVSKENMTKYSSTKMSSDDSDQSQSKTPVNWDDSEGESNFRVVR